MASKTFTERAAFDIGPAKLAEGDTTVEGVAICGTKSRNGRTYPESTLREAMRLYEGRTVYLDHQGDGIGRSIRDRFGRIVNVRWSEGKLRGDLTFIGSHEFAQTFREMVNDDTQDVGLSHVVQAQYKPVREGIQVTKITAVDSVDLVANPATNDSFFESTESSTMEISLTEALAKVSDTHAKRGVLAAIVKKAGSANVELAEDATEADAVAAILGEATESMFAEQSEPPKNEESDTPATGDKALVESIEKLGEGISGVTKRLDDIEHHSLCTRALTEAGIAVREELVTELLPLKTLEEMNQAIDAWPPSKKGKGTASEAWRPAASTAARGMKDVDSLDKFIEALN